MATGTRLMQEISDQFLNCKICFENFREPKTLSCLHTFCSDCLQQQYDSELASRSSRYAIYSRCVTCPLCRKKTDLPTGGIRRLPDNVLVSNLTNVLAKKTAARVPPCEICHSVRGRVVLACSKCLDCNKLLCKGCVDMHISTKVTQQHSLIDLEGEKSIECKIHPEENIRFYCEPCECCICVVCTFQEHKDHDVCSLSDGFNKHKYCLDELLDRSRERMDTVIARLQSIKKYETVVTGVKEKIRDLAISYIAQIRSKERELLKTIEEGYGDKMKELVENKPVLEENIEELQNACNLADIMLKDKGVELLLLKKELSSKMTHLLDLPLPEVPEHKNYDVTFIPGETVLGKLHFGDDKNHNDFDEVVNKSANLKGKNIIKDELNEAKKKIGNDPDVFSNCTQTDLCNTHEIGTSMSADMRVACCNTNSQTELTIAEIEELYIIKDEREKARKENTATSQNQTKEKTPPPDLLPANSFTYTPGRWIRSRKIQTDICSLDFKREMTDREYVHALLVVESYHDPKKSKTSPIPKMDAESKEREQPLRRMSNASTMTIQESQNGTRSLETETRKRTVGRRDAGVNAVCDSKATDTQTPVKLVKESTTLTDVQCQEDKWTCMPPSKLVDRETATTRIYLEDRTTYTDLVSTSDRATSTVGVKQQHKAIATLPVMAEHVSVQVIPETKSMASNTYSTQTIDKFMQTNVPTVDRGTVPDLDIEMKYSKHNNSTFEHSVDSIPTKPPDIQKPQSNIETCDRACDAIKTPMLSKATETLKTKTTSTASGNVTPKYVDRDTTTNVIKTIEQWTETLTPQLVSTGVSPPRPATLDVGVSTIVINTNDEATCTEVRSYRSIQTETTLVVCDNETITDLPISVDAQTSVDISTECTEMETDPMDDGDQKSIIYESQATQCEKPVLHTRETNKSRNRRKAKESQTEFSFVVCKCCKQENVESSESLHVEAKNKNIESGNSKAENKHYNTQEVGTMAFSCTTCDHEVSNMTGVQIQPPLQVDKSSATSIEFTDDFLVRTLSREYQDAATSTESLPYIGLLSEIDVDDMLVIPQANFELVSDSESEFWNYDVEMIDSETCTDYLQYVETGTQTFGIPENENADALGESDEAVLGINASDKSNGKGVGEIIKSLVQSDGGGSVFSNYESGKEMKTPVPENPSLSKHLVSIGINTAPKLMIDQETCTPMRHLYSKDTMTLCVTKLDKSKNTLSPSEACGIRSKSGSREMSKVKSVDKITMTTRAEHKDVGVETDKADIDGRIENCISKLRNVSERLNSPTSRKPASPSFFEKGSGAYNVSNSNDSSSSHHVYTQKDVPESKNLCSSNDNNETKETHFPPKQNDITSIRKPQPITTLKGRKPANVRSVQQDPPRETTNSIHEGSTYDSKSLPRQFVLNRPRPVKMGSQPLPHSRLPLLRYNSAPEQMTTVPPHTISTKPQGRVCPKTKSPSPQTSPSKIPITKKLSPTERSVTTSPPKEEFSKKPCVPDDIWIKKPTAPSSPTQENPNENDSQDTNRPKLRRPLPSITETRTPSTCSESSMTCLASAHSMTPTVNSSVTSTSSCVETPTNSTSNNHPSLDHTKSECGKTKKTTSSSVSSTMTSSMMTSISESLTDSVFKKSTETIHSVASSDTLDETSPPTPQKKSGKGFMQRLLGKKKKNQDPQNDSNSSTTKTSPTGTVVEKVSGGTFHSHNQIPNPSSHNLASSQILHQPESKSPTTSRKSHPFVYVRQRIFPIQQSNVEEAEVKRAAQNVAAESGSSTKKDCVSIPKRKNESKNAEKEKSASASSYEKEKVKSKESKGKKKKSDVSKQKLECKHGKK